MRCPLAVIFPVIAVVEEESDVRPGLGPHGVGEEIPRFYEREVRGCFSDDSASLRRQRGLVLVIHHPDDVILREGTREHPRQTFPQGVLSVLRLRKDGVPPVAQGREHVRNFRDIRRGDFLYAGIHGPRVRRQGELPFRRADVIHQLHDGIVFLFVLGFAQMFVQTDITHYIEAVPVARGAGAEERHERELIGGAGEGVPPLWAMSTESSTMAHWRLNSMV